MKSSEKNPKIKILVKKRIPLKYFFDMLKTAKLSWDWSSIQKEYTPFELNLRILYSLTNKMMRSFNVICLAVNEKKVCVGFNMAFIADNKRVFHPFLFVFNEIIKFLLLFSKHRRALLKKAVMIGDNLYISTRLGLYVLAGENYKGISYGICVAVNPDYRKQGIYKDTLDIILSRISGIFMFQTSTHCDYQAHEKIGFKLLCTLPQPLNDGQSFIMYGDKTIILK